MLKRSSPRPTSKSSSNSIWRLLLLLAVIVVGLPLLACETPVYRYAMYRWEPAPFEVYFFHNGELTEADKELHAEILAIAKDDESPLNCALIIVDLEKDPELTGVLQDVKASWETHKDQLRPGYLVTNPRGSVIHAGPLDTSAVQQLASSPARTTLSKHLQEGHAIVFILLEGDDAEANKAAAGQLTKLRQDVDDGTIELYSVPQDPAAREDAESQQSEGTADPVKPAHSITFITVNRDDAAEKFLVQSLLAVEPDLTEITQPMVFPVYGRARALVPYIGAGIQRDNLLDCMEFITGACSCTVKEQNPGIDLLVRFDWETAAAQIADRFGSEEGNETQFGGEDFFPDIIIGPVVPPAAGGDEVAMVDTTPEETPAIPPEINLVEDNDNAVDNSDNPLAEVTKAEASTVADTSKDPLVKAATSTGVLTIGLLIGVLVIVMLLLSIFVLRPR